MIEEDIKEAKKDHLCNIAGFPVYNHSEYYFRPTNNETHKLDPKEISRATMK